MERQPVASSLLRSVGYDPASSILEIELVEPNRVYTFYDVPFSVYDELLEAPSKGTYFNEFIRDLYAYESTAAGAIPSPRPDVPDDDDAADQPE
jgi:KTSC domain